MTLGAVLAAGEARRFGSVKQLAPFRGRPLIEWPLAALLAGGVDRAIVVIGARADEILAGAQLGGAEARRCDGWREGLAASVRLAAGAAAELGADALVIVLGDQPLLSGEAVRRVRVADPRHQAACASYRGVLGHPMLVRGAALAQLAAVTGESGARGELERLGLHPVPCDGCGSAEDVDTPADLARLEALADRPNGG